jgi:2-C-methyl-D-erythritol 2,4-cyclodiphosphate synthase
MIPDFRIGQGFDVHPLVEGRKLILGGIEIPFPLGLHGHSDADVLSHALGDALLGAAGLGDLGSHFPDSDPRYQGISSLRLLEIIATLLRDKGLDIVNADLTLVAEAPRIASYREAMQGRIAAALQCPPERIHIKATTTEGLGFTGRKEGMAAYAVVLLLKKDEAQS